MNSVRLILSLVLSALLVLACRPAPTTPAIAPAVSEAPLLHGEILLPEGYATQATSGQVRANATVTLIDPATFQAKGTGITAPDGTFTVQALGTFTPTLGSPYLLESTKTLGGTSNSTFRLRTLVQFDASGWTSISGASVQLSATTTAVSILWDHLGLATSAVIGKVSRDATTGGHVASDLSASIGAARVREVEALVGQALLLNLDPVQTVRPGPADSFILAMGDAGRNLLRNAGFEEGSALPTHWRTNNTVNASYSVETASPYEGRQSLRINRTGAGDSWLGQGYDSSNGRAPITLVAGRTYTYSVYARGAVGGEALALAFNYQSPFSEQSSSNFSLTTAWQRYSWTFTAGYSTSQAIFLIRHSTVGSTFYLDAIQLEEGSNVTGYQPQGRLLVDGIANVYEGAGVTAAPGRTGNGIVLESGVNIASNSLSPLQNTSFEVDSNADGVPDGLTQTGAGAVCALDSANALFGQYSLKMDRSGGSTAHIVNYPSYYPFKAGKYYTASIWVKGQNISGAPDNANFGLYLDQRTPSAGYGGTSRMAAPTGTFEWTRLSVSFMWTANCDHLDVYPIFRNKTGIAWWDGLQVEEGTVLTPYGGDGTGLDRLSVDARSFNPSQGAVTFWYRPAYEWSDDRGNGYLAGMTNSADDAILLLRKNRASSGRPALGLAVHDGTNWRWIDWVPATDAWAADTWHHIAMTWGPRNSELFVDGERVGVSDYGGPLYFARQIRLLYFSGLCNNVGYCSSGTLDGLKVWDLQRDQAAIRRDALGVAAL
ncbi:MAG TPA: carbohydrate binding domain-containing protein [Pantanalinema sp.]